MAKAKELHLKTKEMKRRTNDYKSYLGMNSEAADMAKKLQENTLYDVKISNRDELVAVLKQVSNEKENSIAILTDCKCNIRMILDIPNKMFNQKPKER